MKKEKKISLILISVCLVWLIVAFSIAVAKQSTDVVKNIEQVEDVEYESLLGVIDSIPHVERWTIERDKYVEEDYNYINWSLRIYYDNETSIHFNERDSVSELFEDLKNLNESNIHNMSVNSDD